MLSLSGLCIHILYNATRGIHDINIKLTDMLQSTMQEELPEQNSSLDIGNDMFEEMVHTYKLIKPLP